MKKRKKIIAVFLLIAAFFALSWEAGWLLMPVRNNYGAMWDRYQQEDAPVDVLFFGSSIVYCDVAPALIWEETGLKSFIMAGPEQTMPFTYYAIREACRTQSPQLIAVEVRGMFFQKYQKYTKANITYMPFGWNRFAATFAGAEQEEWFGSFFPLYHYHERWKTVKPEDLHERLFPQTDPTAGFTALIGCNVPPEISVDESITAESETYLENLGWLKRIRDFCGKQDISLLLYLSPSCLKVPEAALSALEQDAAALGLEIIDLNEILPSLHTSMETDWFDSLHFNLKGAEKFSRYLGNFLLESGLVCPTEGGEELWTERAAFLAAKQQ